MRLKRLELQGFKSFLDRTILHFDPGITGVVGPNGCGKSNIVDAIQWVMGEQSAKHLRGDSMTDVIFNGSDSRPPTSMAEVTLVLDRGGMALSSQFSSFEQSEDISITRRVYRDGTGEYLINKSLCRLKDIHELFMDTGVGRRAYSIIEQGQIDRMINVKPEERRYLFEEVAGITKYKAKKKEAEKKFELTRQNLTRLEDIVKELEKQIRSLKIQATRARKYKEIKTELESVDLFLLGKKLFEHKKNIETLKSRLEILLAERSETDAVFSRTQAQETDLEVQRIEQEKEYRELGDKERNLSLLIQSLESQSAVFEERKKHLTTAENLGKEEEVTLIQTLDSVKKEQSDQEQEEGNLTQEIAALTEELTLAADALQVRQQELREAEREAKKIAEKKSEILQNVAATESQIDHTTTREEEAFTTQKVLNQKLTDIVVATDVQKKAVEDAAVKIENILEKVRVATEEVASIHNEVTTASNDLLRLEESLFRVRDDFFARRSRLTSLRELQENFEGYSPTARDILKVIGESGIKAVPLGEVLSPESQVEALVERILGDDINTLIVETRADAENLVGIIRKNELERVKIVVLSELVATPETSAPTNAEALMPFVRVEPTWNNVANWWFANTFICETDDGIFQMRQDFPDANFITRDSRTVGDCDRTVSSGVVPKGLGIFARKREIEELATECSALERRVNELQLERENLFQHLQIQEKLHSELRDQLSRLHIESVEFRKEKEKKQIELSRTEKDHLELVGQSERNLAHLERVREQREKLGVELSELERQGKECDENLISEQDKVERLGQELEKSNSKLNDSKIEQSRLEEKRTHLRFRLTKLEEESESLASRLEALRALRERNRGELENIDFEQEQIKGKKEFEAVHLNETLVKISQIKSQFDETCTRLQDLRAAHDELQKKREEVSQELQEKELQLAQENSAENHIHSLSDERYQQRVQALAESEMLSSEKIPLLVEATENWENLNLSDKNQLIEEHLKTLREKVSRYGEVNLTAIQEFDDIQKRYDFLMTQKVDLEKSLQILEEAIKKIEETTKQRFEETFVAVNAKFKEIFPVLFNGGKADMVLTGGENGTEQGVDILVHPPGKRPSTMSLLSGGEKALTAVSLILAIFARKPSPFCLLDEVDAPLDDANVSRFNTVVRKMAATTQFIVITHNKKTMESTEALYGVTMEKSGVSKMTSVRLS